MHFSTTFAVTGLLSLSVAAPIMQGSAMRRQADNGTDYNDGNGGKLPFSQSD